MGHSVTVNAFRPLCNWESTRGFHRDTRPQRPVCRVSSCIPLSSVQFQMLSTRAGKPVCAPPRLSKAFLRSSVGISALSRRFKIYCERFISLRLSPFGDLWCDVTGFGFVPPCCTSSSSTLQIFRSASHLLGCFVCQSICPVISLDSGMPSAAHPQESSKVDVKHGHWPVWASHSMIPLFTFCSKLTGSVKIMACVVRLSSLSTIQRRTYVTGDNPAENTCDRG